MSSILKVRDLSQRELATNGRDATKEMERKYNLKQMKFHQVKSDIIEDLTNKNPMKNVGQNPDIHLSSKWYNQSNV